MPSPNDQTDTTPQDVDVDASTPDSGVSADAQSPVGEKTSSFLDSLTDTGAGANTDDVSEKKTSTTEDGLDADEVAAPDAPTTPTAALPANTGQAPAVDAEEAAMLEGVKSPRAQERIRTILSERKKLESDIEEVRNVIASSGMSANEFAQTLELARLSKSASDSEVRVALEMLEAQRAQLAKRIGVEVPGVDVLADHADLAQAVENLEITRERAIELARYRSALAEQQQAQQLTHQQQQQQQQYQSEVTAAEAQVDAYFATRANEVDHAAKMKVIEEYFADKKNVETFAATYEPKQWLATVQMMYNNIRVASAPAPARSQQPIRSRPLALGVAGASAGDPIQRMSAHLDALGI